MKFAEYITTEAGIGPSMRISKVIITGSCPALSLIDEVIVCKPDTLILCVDDGCPAYRLQELTDLCHLKKIPVEIRRVMPVGNRSVLEADMCFIEWKSRTGSYTSRTVLLGRPGTSGVPYFSIDCGKLLDEDKRNIVQYFQLMEGGVAGSSVTTDLFFRKWFSLPALDSKLSSYPSSFDAWLRRGRLCHKYQPDTSFGRLILRLKKPMTAGAVQGELSRAGFNVSASAQLFSRPYVEFETGTADNSVWRGQYFTETDYGYWTSEECFEECAEQFVAPRAANRHAVISAILMNNAASRESWIAGYLGSVNGIVSRLDNPAQAAEYFHLLPDGSLDKDHYRRSAEEKLGNDRRKADDPWFRSRFTSGFAFPDVPPLGHSFDAFADTLCSALLAKMTGQKVVNKLSRVLNDVLQPDDSIDSGAALLDRLRNDWPVLGQNLIGFYKTQ